MKCIIVYFSQTGNTEKVALAIQSGIKQSTGHCDLVKIQDANPRRLYGYDLIGLGSPVFGEQLGSLGVFLNDMRFAGGKHAFVFCTHGTLPESFFGRIYENAESRSDNIRFCSRYGDCYLLHFHLSQVDLHIPVNHPDDDNFRPKESSEFVENSGLNYNIRLTILRLGYRQRFSRINPQQITYKKEL